MIKDNVKKRLKDLNLSQNDLADKLSVTRQTLNYYLNGNITISKLAEIADALGVHAFQLIQPTNTQSRKPEPHEISAFCPHCKSRISLLISIDTKDQDNTK